MTSDRIDGFGASWYETRSKPGDCCNECAVFIPRGRTVLVERILPMLARPRVLHRGTCWKAHQARIVEFRKNAEKPRRASAQKGQ